MVEESKPQEASDATTATDRVATESGRRMHGFKRWIFLGLLVAGAAVLAHVWYCGSHVDPHQYDADELKHGPIAQIISWDGGRTAVQISQLSALPPDHLWRVVTDQGRFDEFMPYVRSTTVEPGPDGTLIEKQILDLPHTSFELELAIRLSEQDGRRRARWEQKKGTLNFNQGAWIVESLGDRSVLRYQVSASLDWVPQWLVNYAMRRRLGRLLEAVEARVRDLEKREPEYFGS